MSAGPLRPPLTREMSARIREQLRRCDATFQSALSAGDWPRAVRAALLVLAAAEPRDPARREAVRAALLADGRGRVVASLRRLVDLKVVAPIPEHGLRLVARAYLREWDGLIVRRMVADEVARLPPPVPAPGASPLADGGLLRFGHDPDDGPPPHPPPPETAPPRREDIPA